jgi:PAS domain S-box-containing protein
LYLLGFVLNRCIRFLPDKPLTELTVAEWCLREDDFGDMERSHSHSADWLATSSNKVRLGLTIASEQVNVCLHKMWHAASDVGRRAHESQVRFKEAIRDRERHLASLLANSVDAVVVTDKAHRLVAANQAALNLLGVSRKNMNKFTIDAFLSQSEVEYFERHIRQFTGGAATCGECQIRPFNGGLRNVEFTFRTNFGLGRHVSVFREIKPHAQADEDKDSNNTALRYWWHTNSTLDRKVAEAAPTGIRQRNP